MSRAVCKVDGCDRRVVGQGWCGMHYARWKRHGDPLTVTKRTRKTQCEIEGCERPYLAKGMCAMHYMRVRAGNDIGDAQSVRREWGTGSVRPDGYVVLSIDAQRYLRHRYVMEQHLGRPLEPFENVHHKNGVPGDDRVENLEVWTKPQPCGQRPEDLVVWVVEHYPELVKQAMRGKRGDDLRLF